ncbi:hypothetical protein ACFU5O_34505 [Streptomyces sp. NPDC057445]|uniref:hypothetical protein n=1 Tax=Streptomyces sp. NPDC057445 TaxID=3346136 RepID=UPI003691F795
MTEPMTTEKEPGMASMPETARIIPPMPEAPPAVPAAETAPPAAPGRDRRVLRAVARWTVAALVCGGLGAGTALGITSMERTDVPGLATESDGRWDYPKLSLPALPEGTPRPFNEGNVQQIHHADLRKLLLSAPVGATVDKKLTGGWVTPGQFSAEFVAAERSDLERDLKDHGARHIAARGWTMPDGTVCRIYLLQFGSADSAEAFKGLVAQGTRPHVPLAGTSEFELDRSWTTVGHELPTASYVYRETAPVGAEETHHAYIVSGDTLALVIQSRKGKAPAVPFHQTVVLQNQLLG